MVFDCDGVLLDSNLIKTDAFYDCALPYGRTAAQALRDFHVQRGGISRYAKFEHFLRHIVGQSTVDETELKALIDRYGAQVRSALLTCPAAHGLAALRQATPQARWMVVSGSDQTELREVLLARGWGDWFDGGIFGSPDTKDTILQREISQACSPTPAVFFGDSAYDQQAALAAGLEFVFVSDWSEAVGTFEVRGQHVPRLSALLGI